MTSMPFLSAQPIAEAAMEATRFATFAKYYRPLARLPNVTQIYQHLVNIPCHADMAALSDEQILADLAVLGIATARPQSSRPGSATAQERPSEPLDAAVQDHQEAGGAYGGYHDVAVPLQRF